MDRRFPRKPMKHSKTLKSFVLMMLVVGLVMALQKRARAQDPTVKTASPSAQLISLLRAKDQSLLDAFAPGDRMPWKNVISADFVYVDENNSIMNRSDFLMQLLPLPLGASGNIAIRSYQVSLTGDTAIVVHRDDETEYYFGSELHAEYLMTETWQRINGSWMLRVVHAAAVPTDPAPVVLTHGEIDELAGTYRAGELTYTIRRDGGRIVGGRSGRPEVELKAETRDVLFVPGQPRSLKVFRRDAHGQVVGFADRRENRDLVWTVSAIQ